MRLDEDGYEYPGPHADVLFGLEPDTTAGQELRRRGFWTKLVGRAPGAHGRKQAGSGTV
ncbi:hypothetical protein [Actinophytocola sp.]|uniref:hypothetical protein n=1 Tax=Actinophytocola sp. TaxID=1872138 RepID=UPI00389AE28A